VSTLRARLGMIVGLALGGMTLGCATQSAPRQGFNVGFGYSAMTADYTCSGCTLPGGSSDHWEGASGAGGYLRMGGSVSQRLLLGGEIGVGGAGEVGYAHVGERSSAMSHLLFTGQYYVAGIEGLHVSGGIGPAHFSLVTNHVGSHQGGGLMLRVGAGYDWHLMGRFAVTPHVLLSRASVGEIRTYGSVGPASDIGIKGMAQLGIGLNWY
jgi:hypothetical protein